MLVLFFSIREICTHGVPAAVHKWQEENSLEEITFKNPNMKNENIKIYEVEKRILDKCMKIISIHSFKCVQCIQNIKEL